MGALLLFLAGAAFPVALAAVGAALVLSTSRQVGGLLFWRAGRVGGSIYVAKGSR